MPEPALAFISKRKLYLHRDRLTREIPSDFERSVRERAASLERRHAWKSQGRGAMFMGARASAAGGGGPDVEIPVLLTGVAATEDGGLLYSMETDAVSGVFLREAGGAETRLFHTADFRIRQIALSPSGETLAATVFHKESMRSNIAIVPVRGTDYTEVTEGDSFDGCPRWVPGAQRRLIFQSSGVGRNAAGQFAGLGSSVIQELDLDSGDLTDVAEQAGHDLIQPRRTGDGTLCYIRKPYETHGADTSFLTSLKDAALFPVRMGLAVFQYFNVFSMMYTGKPLVTAKGAAQRQMDPRMMFINGNLASALAGGNGPDSEVGLVPKSWELIRGGEVVGKGVLSYDIRADGSILYTDGVTIYQIDSGGEKSKVLKSEQIEQVLGL